MIDGKRVWIEWEDVDVAEDDFGDLGNELDTSGAVTLGLVGLGPIPADAATGGGWTSRWAGWPPTATSPRERSDQAGRTKGRPVTKKYMCWPALTAWSAYRS